MTTVLDQPTGTPPVPTRRPPLSAGGRTLAWAVGGFGALFVVWSALSFASLIAREKTTDESTHEARDVIELVADGRVAVTPAEPGVDEVHVDREARFAFSGPRYSTTVSGDRLVVAYRCSMTWVLNCDTSLDVTLPAGTRLVVRSSVGDIRVEGIVGDVDLRTSDGKVETHGLGGDVIARSSNGNVVVVDTAGDVTARTNDGSVTVRGARSVDASSDNGRVEVEDVAGEVVARSSNGTVEVADARADITATSSNGNVRVYGTGEPVALDIDTSNGRRTVEAATDPAAKVHVTIRSSNGGVSYLPPRG